MTLTKANIRVQDASRCTLDGAGGGVMDIPGTEFFLISGVARGGKTGEEPE